MQRNSPMKHRINLTNPSQSIRRVVGQPRTQSRFRLGVLAVGLALLLLIPAARAVSPPPDGGYPNQNTAEGTDALFTLTSGANNTAVGFDALFSNSSGSDNTATGSNTLSSNTTGRFNTGSGSSALQSNTTGEFNTASGYHALFSNNVGVFNTATGTYTLELNTIGYNNTASGYRALANNTSGNNNTASGYVALHYNTAGSSNTAAGYNALYLNGTGNSNTAEGGYALYNNTAGSNNTALGSNAGLALTTGSDNIDIGNPGLAGESAKIRIGTRGTHNSAFIAGIYGATLAGGTAVMVDNKGHLGTITSSECYKRNIKPMDEASEAILALKPVTFRYKPELDPEAIPQFGLVAEQVEKVNRDLVSRDEEGKPYTVRYEAVNATLLRVPQRAPQGRGTGSDDHRTKSADAKEKAILAQQKKDFARTIAQQQEIEALTTSLREQAAQIQKVSDQLKVSKAAPRVVAFNE